MKVFDVMCVMHRIGRFLYKPNAEKLRAKFISDNELDAYEVDICERTI